MTLQIRVDNLTINRGDKDGFLSMRCYRDLESLCGQFFFSATFAKKAFNDYPIKRGYKVEILADGHTWMTGYVEEIEVNYDDKKLDVSIAGRDITADVVDASCGPRLSFTGPITLKSLIEQTLKVSGDIPVKVINKVESIEAFSQNELIAADIGRDLISFIGEYARKREVLLVTDGAGNLVIERPSSTPLNVKIQNVIGKVNNILTARMRISDTERFSQYNVVSQGNGSLLDFSGESLKSQVFRTGSANDNAVRSSRQRWIQAENASSNSECKLRADWEANNSRARSLTYECEIDGHSIQDGTPVNVNQLYPIVDDFAGITATMLVRRVDLISDPNQGNVAKLVFTTPDAYTPQPVLSPKQKKSNEIALVWNDEAF